MQKWIALLLISAGLQAQDRSDLPPLDGRAWGVVLEDPKTKNVVLSKDVEYLKDPKGSLHIDIYRPSGLKPGELKPAVIFLNGLGDAPGQEKLKNWGIYSSWPRLVAAYDMIGISMETDGTRVNESFDALFRFLREEGARHHVDASSIGVYAASANVSTALPYLMSSRAPSQVRAAVMYYGGFIPGPYRKDLPLLFVIAEGDVPRNNYRELLAEILKNNAPWTVSMATGLPHAFDAFEDSDVSRRMIRQTLMYWKNHLEPLPPRTTPKAPGREILSAQYAHDDKRLIVLLESWLVTHNTDAGAWFQYASALKNERRYAESEQAYRKVLVYEPENVRALTYLYLLMYQLNRPDEAAPLLAAAEKIGIDRFTYVGMGYTMYSLNRHREGVPFFEKAVEMAPTPNSLYNLACGYARLGEKDKAFAALDRAITAGYADRSHLESDTDLTSLHGDPRFEKILNDLSSQRGASAPPARAHHALVYDESRRGILLTNGSTPLNGGSSYKFFNDLWLFDGARWISQGSASDERSGNRIAYNPHDRKVYSYGGFFSNNEMSGQLRVLEGTEWKVLADVAEMKATEGGFVYDSDRKVFVAFGGSTGRNNQNSATWEWDGTAWKKFAGPGPGARDAFAMVYDSKQKKTVIFGGHGDTPGGYFGDTWTFDGKAWKRVATDGPEPRLTPGYAYDSKRGWLYVFGGFGDHKVFGDLWCWNGTEWKKLADTGPSPRGMGYMTYDAARDRIVLFGGRPQWLNDTSDTWEWDGGEWKEIR